ncbi:MAG: hypothetical protein LM571_01970 [Desulfurococcaceae archaeon]|nr:hypothetical protein [Desulfurococcaceae archaeon]
MKEASKKGEGVIQSELWHALGIDSREGSKIVARLIRRGLLMREAVVHKGKKTYKLYYSDSIRTPVSISVNLNPAIEVPCFSCRQINRCGVGGYYDPTKCPLLTKYITQLVLRRSL